MVKARDKHKLGQTLVEFALLLTLLLMVIFGIFDFGRTFQAWMTVQHSAQAAARYASTGQQYVDPSTDIWDKARLAAVKAEALRSAAGLLIDNSAGESEPGYFRVYVYAVAPTGSGSLGPGTEYPGGPNARVAVDVVYNQALITPFLSSIAPFIRLTGHSEMITERFRFPGYGTPPGALPPTIPPTPTPTVTPTPTITPIPTNTPTSTLIP